MTFDYYDNASHQMANDTKPPKDGMTSPPADCIEEIDAPKEDEAIGLFVSPFQYGVHDPWVAAWMKAMVRYFAPDCWERAAGSSPVHASK
jgi:hypothetical protein